MTVAPAELVAVAVMSAVEEIVGGAGGTNGLIVITSVVVPVRPLVSVALHVTVVCPTGNFVPETGLHVAGMVPSMASIAELVNVATAPPASVAASVWSPDVVIVGGVAWTSVTVKVPEPLVPKIESVPLHVTVVAPGAKTVPEAGAHVTAVTGDPAVQVGVNVATVPAALGDPTLMFGFVRTGATP